MGVQLRQLVEFRRIVERPWRSMVRVPDRVKRLTVGGRRRKLQLSVHFMLSEHAEYVRHGPFEGLLGVALQAVGERQVEDQLGIGRSADVAEIFFVV